ncbi:uncharacterized protein LOC121833629 [Ixodes scapularis]|uniref:uncharacterized protein LOC121833629 n=1 Tax=Ixodes scapularis TaxID=6945 RepID=UPI001A9DAEA9|nr:uncharacterized protein LOC121833629 [Ixodes scapularis]
MVENQTHRFHSPGTFDAEKENWKLYQIRFQACLDVAKITAEADKRNLLIASIGPKTFKLLYSLIQPQSFLETPYQELLKKLEEHFAPKKFKEFERAKLFSARQEENETIKDFITRLRSILINCDYESEADARSSSLLTAFIVGLRDTRVRARLVLEKDLTLDVALRLAESTLTAEAESRRLDRGDHAALLVEKVKPSTSAPVKCFRCGNTNHSESSCRFRTESCNACGKRGHIAKVCRSAERHKTAGKKKEKVKTITNVFVTPGSDGEFVSCIIQGTPVRLQVDTGSKLTLLDTDTWRKIGKPTLQKCDYNLFCFNQKKITVQGRCLLQVTLGKRSEELEALMMLQNLGMHLKQKKLQKVLMDVVHCLSTLPRNHTCARQPRLLRGLFTALPPLTT